MIHYASANIAGFSYKSNVDVLQKDRRGLGFKSRLDQLDIISHSIRPGDINGLIFFSDGVIDQVNPSTGRVLGKKRYHNAKNFISRSRIFFNHFLTQLSNIINRQNLSDAHTCYKVFARDVFLSLKLKEKGFSFCPEVNSKVARLNLKIREVEINYNGRTYLEGKKISLIDGVYAILSLIRYGLLKLD